MFKIKELAENWLGKCLEVMGWFLWKLDLLEAVSDSARVRGQDDCYKGHLLILISFKKSLEIVFVTTYSQGEKSEVTKFWKVMIDISEKV